VDASRGKIKRAENPRAGAHARLRRTKQLAARTQCTGNLLVHKLSPATGERLDTGTARATVTTAGRGTPMGSIGIVIKQ
jgi:hypothetical protein